MKNIRIFIINFLPHAIFCFALIVSVYSIFNKNFAGRRILNYIQNSNNNSYLKTLNKIDSLPSLVAPHKNIYIKFNGFDDWKQSGIYLQGMIFQKTAYNIYPNILFSNDGNYTPFDKKRRNHLLEHHLNSVSLMKKLNISNEIILTKDKNNTSMKTKRFFTPSSRQKKQINSFSSILLSISIAFITILLTGAAFCMIIFKKIDYLNFISLSFLFGVSTVAFILQTLSISGFDMHYFYLVGIAFTSILILLFKKKHLKEFLSPQKKFSTFIKKSFSKTDLFYLIFFTILFVIMLLVICGNIFILPVYSWDAFMIWLFKTKILLFRNLADNDIFTYRPYGYAHLKYPLLYPFICAMQCLILSEYNEICAKSIAILFFIASVLFCIKIYFEQSKSLILSLGATIFTVFIPVFIKFCGVGSADPILTIFYAASIFFQFKCIEKISLENLIPAIFFTASAAMIKNEGIALALISICLFTLFITIKYKNILSVKYTLYFIFGIILIMTPWLIWNHKIPNWDENYLGHLGNLFTLKNYSKTILILKSVFGFLFSLNFLYSGFLFFLSLLLISPTILKKEPVFVAFSYLIIHLLLYIAIFTITPWNLDFLISTALERMILHLQPAFYLFICTVYKSSRRFTNK